MRIFTCDICKKVIDVRENCSFSRLFRSRYNEEQTQKIVEVEDICKTCLNELGVLIDDGIPKSARSIVALLIFDKELEAKEKGPKPCQTTKRR